MVGGFHSLDCVRRVAEEAYNLGINTLVDLDLTDLFFTLYKKEDYFDINKYDSKKYYEYTINSWGSEYVDFNKQMLDKNYSSQVYGFNNYSNNKDSFIK